MLSIAHKDDNNRKTDNLIYELRTCWHERRKNWQDSRKGNKNLKIQKE